MATTGASARQWLSDTQPGADELNDVIGKLQARIDAWSEDDERVQGSIEALDVLESEVARRGVAHGSSSGSNPDGDPVPAELDTRPLVEHADVVRERPPAEKRAVFEQLKQSIGHRPKTGKRQTTS